MVVVDPPSQHAFENLEDSAKDGIIDELLKRGPDVFAEVAKNQWGSYCIQHSQCIAPTKRRILTLFPVLEHGSEKHRELALDHLLGGLLEFSTNEQGFKSVTKALKEGDKSTYDKFVNRMRECPLGYVSNLMWEAPSYASSISQRPKSHHSGPGSFCHGEPTDCDGPPKCKCKRLRARYSY